MMTSEKELHYAIVECMDNTIFIKLVKENDSFYCIEMTIGKNGSVLKRDNLTQTIYNEAVNQYFENHNNCSLDEFSNRINNHYQKYGDWLKDQLNIWKQL